MKYIVTINGKKYEVEVEKVSGNGSSKSVENKVNISSSDFNGKINITAPLPGKILNVNISEGQKVKKGDVLFILEAMKMENEVMAPQDGVVAKVLVSKGAQVNSGDLLASLN
ncbi:biotin/lipoyl-binding protein [Caldicellulosiruptoraceae bacterium PP1]